MESSVRRLVRLAGRDDTQLADRRPRARLTGVQLSSPGRASACRSGRGSPRNGFLTSASWSSAQTTPERSLVGDPRGVHGRTVPVGTTRAVGPTPAVGADSAVPDSTGRAGTTRAILGRV